MSEPMDPPLSDDQTDVQYIVLPYIPRRCGATVAELRARETVLDFNLECGVWICPDLPGVCRQKNRRMDS